MKAQLIDVGLSSPKSIRTKKVEQFYLDFPFHFHDSFEMVLIEESYGTRIVGDNISSFNKGDLVLMGPNLPHIWQNDSIFFLKKKGYHVKALVIYFSPLFLIDLLDEKKQLDLLKNLFAISERGLHFTGNTHLRAMEKLLLLSQEEGLRKISIFLDVLDLLMKSNEYELLASDCYKSSFTCKDTDRINKVYQFLISNFHRDISLKEIAAIGNMSPTAFCKYFKSRTQKTLTQFISELRIQQACKLLKNKDYSISEVCYECGFNNLVHFNKNFKTITGTTPTTYRINLEKIDSPQKFKL